MNIMRTYFFKTEKEKSCVKRQLKKMAEKTLENEFITKFVFQNIVAYIHAEKRQLDVFFDNINKRLSKKSMKKLFSRRIGKREKRKILIENQNWAERNCLEDNE